MLFFDFGQSLRKLEAGNLPGLKLQGGYDEARGEIVEVGVRIMAEGLYPGSNGLCLSYLQHGAKPVVTEGPSTVTFEAVAGVYSNG